MSETEQKNGLPTKQCPKLEPHAPHRAYSLDFTDKNKTGDPRVPYECPGLERK